MIISSRNFPFGARVTRLQTIKFSCSVSTAKEGWFQKQSTMIAEVEATAVDVASAGLGKLRPCGKIIYSPSLRTSGPVKAFGLPVDDVQPTVRVFSDTVVLAVSCSPLA